MCLLSTSIACAFALLELACSILLPPSSVAHAMYLLLAGRVGRGAGSGTFPCLICSTRHVFSRRAFSAGRVSGGAGSGDGRVAAACAPAEARCVEFCLFVCLDGARSVGMDRSGWGKCPNGTPQVHPQVGTVW